MRKICIFGVVCFLISVCLPVAPAGAWSSADGGTHYYIIEDAYKKLETDDIFLNLLPDKDVIYDFTGYKESGADAEKNPYEIYRYSNHYYNPSAAGGRGQGNAPQRAQHWYDVLIEEIRAGRGSGRVAAQAAAFLAHYVADVGVPYHVIGEEIAGPGLGIRDWRDIYYQEGHIAPTGDHPKWELKAMFYNTTGYWGISSEWETCRTKDEPVACFVKAIAARTESRLEDWMPVDSNKTESLRHSMQDVYTVYRAAYEAGTSQWGGSESESLLEIVGAARWFAETYYGHSMDDWDFRLVKVIRDQYALVMMVPRQEDIDKGTGIVLEKYEGQWVVADFGAGSPDWREKVPELFE